MNTSAEDKLRAFDDLESKVCNVVNAARVLETVLEMVHAAPETLGDYRRFTVLNEDLDQLGYALSQLRMETQTLKSAYYAGWEAPKADGAAAA